MFRTTGITRLTHSGCSLWTLYSSGKALPQPELRPGAAAGAAVPHEGSQPSPGLHSCRTRHIVQTSSTALHWTRRALGHLDHPRGPVTQELTSLRTGRPCFTPLHCTDTAFFFFCKLKARPSTSKKITTHFVTILTLLSGPGTKSMLSLR